VNINVALEIVELALSLAKTQKDAAIAGILVQIVEKAVQAYQDHTGEALDPTLIKAEDGL
jgi:hypothetical protein